MPKQKILIVDDIAENIKILVDILHHDYELFMSTNGINAFKIIEKNTPDLILLDIIMPEMDGYEICEKLKNEQKTQDIPVIFITAKGEESDETKGLTLGAIDYITKPFNAMIVKKRIINHLSLKWHRDILAQNNEALRRAKAHSDDLRIEADKRSEELEKAYKQLEQTQAQLFQSRKLVTLGEMSAGLAHEINQPLAGISLVAKLFRRLLAKDKLTKIEIEEGLNDTEHSIKRITRIINHIRTFARQDELEFIDVNIAKSINSALILVSEQLRLHGIKMVDNFSSNDLPTIYGDPYQLEQVWINCITNAKDALDKKETQELKNGYKKSLVISTKHTSESNKISVIFEDNGIGIPDDMKNKIFDPFFTSKEIGKGTGLGLSISYGIVTKHKGDISVTSEQNQGTTFTINLPILNDETKLSYEI